MQIKRFKHKKRGSIYQALEIVYNVDTNYTEGDTFILGTPFGELPCEIQCSTKPESSLVIYKPVEGPFRLYARPESEFFDGRFEECDFHQEKDEELAALLEQLPEG